MNLKTMKRILAIVLVNTALLAAVVVITELVFGNWIRQDNSNQLNIIRSRKIKYNVEGLYDSSSKTITYTRDRYGLRGSFQQPSDIVILTVGGSTTDQRLIADGRTWQDVLQQEFESIGKKVIVANAGVDGQSTYGHIKNFDWWFPYIPGLKPKYILFYIGLNDFYKDEGFGYDALIISAKDRSMREILREKSALYHMLRTVHGMYLAKFRQRIFHGRTKFDELEWTRVPLMSSYDKLMRTRLKEYSERLNVLIAKTKEFGSRPILVTQPCRRYRLRKGIIEGVKQSFSYDNVLINGVDYYYMMREINDVTCSVSQEHNIPCIDLAKEMVCQDDDFYDLFHMTPKGAKKVGECLFEKLRDKL